MGSQTKRLKKKSGLARKSKISETIIDFAQPVFDVLGDPHDIHDLRQLMKLVGLCWNLPVFEESDARVYAEAKSMFDASMAALDGPLAIVFTGLLESRRESLRENPFMVAIEVRGDTLEDARIVAEARVSI